MTRKIRYLTKNKSNKKARSRKKFRAFYFMSETEKYGNNAHKKAFGRGKYEQKGKRFSYKTAVNACLSFSNEVMASEPFFEERSDAVKMSETPYPTNGSGKNLGKGCKI